MKERQKNSDQSPAYHYDGATAKDIHGRNRTEHRVILRCVKLVDVIAVGIPFGFTWLHFYLNQMTVPYYRMGNVLIIALYYVIYYLTSHLYSGFNINVKRISEIFFAQTLALIITNLISFVVIWLLLLKLPNIPVMLSMLCVQMGIAALWAFLSHQWYFSTYPARPSVIIYDEMQGMDGLIDQYGLDKHFCINNTMSVTEVFGDIERPMSKMEEQACIHQAIGDNTTVFLCGLHSHWRNQFVKYCTAYDKTAYVIPRIGDVIMAGAVRMPLFHEPVMQLQRYNPAPEYLFVKRAFDILISGIALVVFSPLMAVLALIIRRDGGTALYRQTRLTKNGKEFKMLKFRSMRMDAEKDGVARLSTGEDDPRLTKIGKKIRACRLDELPQLINIFKGDMSIVGPRPERPEIAAIYKESLPEFDLRLQCRCGLTGYAQVYGQYNTTPYNKLLMDLMYISKPSLAEDLRICMATVKVLMEKDSTEGIKEGQTTAEEMIPIEEKRPAKSIHGMERRIG